jgi:hypothetical protein
VVVANAILEVRGMLLQQWLILFSTACFGNILGLNISAGMRTAVSIYILIPLILVPQLLLGGAMIKFDDLHQSISKKIYVPVVGDIMATRWAYEAICVEQFKSNRFEKPFFKYDMEKSQNDWYVSFLIPTLNIKVDGCLSAGKKPENKDYSEENFRKINFHIKDLSELTGIKPGKWIRSLNYTGFNDIIADDTKHFLDSLKNLLRQKSKILTIQHDSLINLEKRQIGEEQFIRLRENDYNESLADFVLNRNTTNKIYEAEDKLIQKADPVFMKPGSKYGRAHFLAPYKQLGNLKIGTLLFNMIAIWIMTIIFFITLYFNILKRFILFLETLKLPIWRKFGRELLQI